MQRLKGTTAREANRELCRAGTPFWQHESYDRLVRDAQEFGRIENYIVQNPVRAWRAEAGSSSIIQRLRPRTQPSTPANSHP